MFTIAIRENENFTELQLNNFTVKTSMFADDTMIFLNGLERQFDLIFDILINFGFFSRCTINWDKSKAFYIGAGKQWKKSNQISLFATS